MRKFITVTELNRYIQAQFDSDDNIQNFWLKGEISGFKLYQQSGHMYFTLKDENSAISSVMFKSRVSRLKFKPEDGMEVLIRGSIAVFAKQGRYQMYAEEMHPYGVGELFLYLEQLKTRLADEGYFKTEKKKEIPRMVNRVGVVTSQDGAALRDILRVLRQRHPAVEVVIAHSSVQGLEAPRELARGIELLNEYAQVDLIIVGRGGGSLEDLMAFNSEEIVKAIYNSTIPVISAVGHEVDITLSDLTADLRAATPTQAAQYAVPDFTQLQKDIEILNKRMSRLMDRNLSLREELLDKIMMKKVWKEPGLLLEKQEQGLRDKEKALAQIMEKVLSDQRYKVALAAGALDNLSPLKVMARGYSILNKDRKIIKSIKELQTGDRLQARLIDGELDLELKGKETIEG